MNPISPTSQRPTILLTIDVEDWFQVENLRPWFPPKTWNQQELRVERNTHNLLDILDSIKLKTPLKNRQTPKATFFILGWIAERLPKLVSEIQSRGHEVASHGHNHLMCQKIDQIALKEDLVRSKKTIEDIIGNEVNGYRAPSFSISDAVLDMVKTSGYRYDSSYNNFSKHGRYGVITINGKSKTGAAIRIGKDFAELPISNLTIGHQIIPWGGGGYFRFLPLPIFKTGVQRILKKTGAYMFYMHPWEMDPGQPRVKEAKGFSGWRHYLNLTQTHARLKNFITFFKHCNFPTCSQYLDDIN